MLLQGAAICELFAGKMSATNAFRRLGQRALPFELQVDSDQNLLSGKGLALAVRLLLQVSCAGLLWLAPVCSSWSWINRRARYCLYSSRCLQG